MISFKGLPHTTNMWIEDQTSKARTGFNRLGQVSRDDILNELQVIRTRVENRLPVTQEQIEHLGKLVGERVGDWGSQVQHAAEKIEKPNKWSKRVWLSTGIGVGFAAAAVATIIVLRRQSEVEHAEKKIASSEQHPSHQSDAKGIRSIVQAMTRHNEQNGTHSHVALGVATQAVDVAETYQVVGNVRTRSYVSSNNKSLPAEDHRIYFHTEQEAQDAGYHAETESE